MSGRSAFEGDTRGDRSDRPGPLQVRDTAQIHAKWFGSRRKKKHSSPCTPSMGPPTSYY